MKCILLFNHVPIPQFRYNVTVITAFNCQKQMPNKLNSFVKVLKDVSFSHSCDNTKYDKMVNPGTVMSHGKFPFLDFIELAAY